MVLALGAGAIEMVAVRLVRADLAAVGGAAGYVEAAAGLAQAVEERHVAAGTRVLEMAAGLVGMAAELVEVVAGQVEEEDGRGWRHGVLVDQPDAAIAAVAPHIAIDSLSPPAAVVQSVGSTAGVREGIHAAAGPNCTSAVVGKELMVAVAAVGE